MLLEVKNLHTYFKTKKGIVKAVNDVTYSLEAGKTLGIVGESGSGKSVSAMSIIKLLDGNGYIESGDITFDGKDILKCTSKEMYHIRGNEISVIFQEPMTSLNPVFHRGAADRRGFADPPEPLEESGAAEGHRAALRREDPEPGARGQAVPLPAFRRHAPARDDRDGAGLPSRSC